MSGEAKYRILFGNRKEQSNNINLNMVILENTMEVKEAITKDHVLSDLIYIKYPEQANPLRQKGLGELREMRCDCQRGWRFFRGAKKMF